MNQAKFELMADEIIDCLQIGQRCRGTLAAALRDAYLMGTRGEVVLDGSIVIVCEHGVKDGDWCEPCRRDVETARNYENQVRGD